MKRNDISHLLRNPNFIQTHFHKTCFLAAASRAALALRCLKLEAFNKGLLPARKEDK